MHLDYILNLDSKSGCESLILKGPVHAGLVLWHCQNAAAWAGRISNKYSIQSECRSCGVIGLITRGGPIKMLIAHETGELPKECRCLALLLPIKLFPGPQQAGTFTIYKMTPAGNKILLLYR